MRNGSLLTLIIMETNQLSQTTPELIENVPVKEIGSVIVELIKKINAKDAAKILAGGLGVAGIIKLITELLKSLDNGNSND